MMHLLQICPFKVITTLFLQIQSSRQLSLVDLFSLLRPCFSWGPTTSNTVISSLGSSRLYSPLFNLVYLGPYLPMQRFHSTLANKHLILLPSTSHLLFLHPPHSLMLWMIFYTSGCLALDFLHRSLFGDSLSLYDLWSRPWGCSASGAPWSFAMPPSLGKGWVITTSTNWVND